MHFCAPPKQHSPGAVSHVPCHPADPCYSLSLHPSKLFRLSPYKPHNEPPQLHPRCIPTCPIKALPQPELCTLRNRAQTAAASPRPSRSLHPFPSAALQLPHKPLPSAPPQPLSALRHPQITSAAPTAAMHAADTALQRSASLPAPPSVPPLSLPAQVPLRPPARRW